MEQLTQIANLFCGHFIPFQEEYLGAVFLFLCFALDCGSQWPITSVSQVYFLGHFRENNSVHYFSKFSHLKPIQKCHGRCFDNFIQAYYNAITTVVMIFC